MIDKAHNIQLHILQKEGVATLSINHSLHFLIF